jgi:Armadillo/beta-catenin-like repeat
MVDDLQTWCVASLRRHLYPAGGSRSCAPRLDRAAAVDAIFERMKLHRPPDAAVRGRGGPCRRLLPAFAGEEEGRQVPSHPEPFWPQRAGAALVEILRCEGDDHRHIVLGSMVRRLMGDEPASQRLSTTRFLQLMGVDEPPIQRVIASGVVPRFVEFLRRDDNPDLQRGAVDALVSVVFVGHAWPGQVRAVLDAGAIPQFVRFVRLLRSSGLRGRGPSGAGARAHCRCER